MSMLRERIRRKSTANSSGLSTKVSMRNTSAKHCRRHWRDILHIGRWLPCLTPTNRAIRRTCWFEASDVKLGHRNLVGISLHYFSYRQSSAILLQYLKVLE